MKKEQIIFLALLSLLLGTQSIWSQNQLEVEGDSYISGKLGIGKAIPESLLPTVR